jgi:hypothetical protein
MVLSEEARPLPEAMYQFEEVEAGNSHSEEVETREVVANSVVSPRIVDKEILHAQDEAAEGHLQRKIAMSGFIW